MKAITEEQMAKELVTKYLSLDMYFTYADLEIRQSEKNA